MTLPVLGASWTEQRERPSGGTYDVVDRLLSTQDCDKARRFMRAAKVAATKGAACWCPNGCDELVDLTSATPQCRICAVEVCTTCLQKKHSGDCVAASNAADEALWRDNWQRCPGCKAIVEKKEACDHMRCRCGTTFCYNCGARGHGCPMKCMRPRVFDPPDAQRPVNTSRAAADY